MNQKTFIKCSDEETIQKLRELGFQEVGRDGKVITFLNIPSLNNVTFSSKNVSYSSNMTF